MTNAIALAKKIEYRFEEYKKHERFEQIAQLITLSLNTLPQKYSRQIFGYIPAIFRQIDIKDCLVRADDIYRGEPVVYKVYFPEQKKLYGLAYFYIFCYLKLDSQQLNVYFQSANPIYEELTQLECCLSQKKISFEGSISAFKPDNISVISISDPGHFKPGLTSSFYVGSPELNFNQVIAQVIESICNAANLSLSETLLFGSSAGTFGALLSSTYLAQKTNVLAVNSQINLHYKKELMQSIFGITQPEKLLDEYGDRLSCIYRFNQEITSIPNIYLLANINDKLHERNFKFYQQYISKFTAPGIDNQSVFDSYYGVEGHGRPEPNSLKAKIKIAREVLTMKSTVD